MKIKLLLLTLLMSSCTVIIYDDVNKYKGCVIQSIEKDTTIYKDTVELNGYRTIIKDIHGNYHSVLLNPVYGKLFHVKDTI